MYKKAYKTCCSVCIAVNIYKTQATTELQRVMSNLGRKGTDLTIVDSDESSNPFGLQSNESNTQSPTLETTV